MYCILVFIENNRTLFELKILAEYDIGNLKFKLTIPEGSLYFDEHY